MELFFKGKDLGWEEGVMNEAQDFLTYGVGRPKMVQN